MNDSQSQAREKHKKNVIQFIIFAIVGVSNTLVDLIVYWLLLQLSVYYVIANVVSYGAGMLNSYLWNRNVTFKENRADRSKQTIIRFIVWNASTLLLSTGIIYCLTELFELHALLSKIIATCIVLAIQFLGNKLWVFK